MSWLLRDGDVLAVIEDRRKGWHRSLQGAVVIRAPAVVQTITSAASLDVAFCGPADLDQGLQGLRVRRMTSLSPRRVAQPRFLAGALVVAPSGTFERWRLQVGDCLEVRGG
jgi:hypothetical protein